MTQNNKCEVARALLRGILLRLRWNDQGGFPGYLGDGKWLFVSTGLPQVTPDELNTLMEFAGIVPDKIESLGPCSNCAHSIDGGERGYNRPCISCLRPRHDLWEARQ